MCSTDDKKLIVMQEKMKIEYRKAQKTDAALLVDIYNAAFYDDYVKYGECPAYNRTIENMERSIESFPKHIIYVDGEAAGVISVENKGNGEYYLGCLAVIPRLQGKGIGTAAIRFMLNYYGDLKTVTLVTPSDKEQNVRFYTEKCGFRIVGEEQDGNVKVYRFLFQK